VILLNTYNFTSKTREFGRVVFALTLDRKRLKERIVIGKVDEVRRLLNGGDGEIYHDEIRPLGSLLLTFESNTDGVWNKHIHTLRESYKKFRNYPLSHGVSHDKLNTALEWHTFTNS